MPSEVSRWPRRLAQGLAIRMARRPGWSGFGAGVVAGGAVVALLALGLPAVLAPGDDLEPGPLVILTGVDQSAGGQHQKLIDEWNQLHPRNPASIIPVRGGADAERAEMVARAQSHDHGVDIYNLDVISIAEFAEAGYIRPLSLTDADTAGFLAGPLATCRYAGKLWALPFNSDAGLLFYRSDLVPKAPQSLAEMDNDIATVFDGGGPPAADDRVVAGYAGQLRDYEGLTVNALEAIWAAGGEVVDADQHVVIDSPQARAGLRWLARGLSRSNPEPILHQSAAFDEAASTQAFYEHKVLFLRMWPVAYRSLEATPQPGAVPAAAPGAAPAAPSAGPTVTSGPTASPSGPSPSGPSPSGPSSSGLPPSGPIAPPSGSSPSSLSPSGSSRSGPPQFRVSPLPGPSVLGGQDLAVARSSRRPRAAQALIQFLTSERSQQILFERGGYAATRDVVYHDSAVLTEYPYASVLLGAIRSARPRPVTPHYSRFSEVFRQVVRAALADGGELPADATDRLTRALRGY